MIKLLKKYLLAINFNLLLIIKSISILPWYFRQKFQFKKLMRHSNWYIKDYPIRLDRDSQAGSLGEYFWQDLFVAKEIIKLNPKRHVDVGSRIDGFIVHLACTRKIEIFDIRYFNKDIENVKFTQWDMTNPNKKYQSLSDCVSCLHTLEHIGLGRYGDNLDPDGWKKGFDALIDLVSISGSLFLSVPIGIERIEFNAHRVFNPKTIKN